MNDYHSTGSIYDVEKTEGELQVILKEIKERSDRRDTYGPMKQRHSRLTLIFGAAFALSLVLAIITRFLMNPGMYSETFGGEEVIKGTLILFSVLHAAFLVAALVTFIMMVKNFPYAIGVKDPETKMYMTYDKAAQKESLEIQKLMGLYELTERKFSRLRTAATEESEVYGALVKAEDRQETALEPVEEEEPAWAKLQLEEAEESEALVSDPQEEIKAFGMLDEGEDYLRTGVISWDQLYGKDPGKPGTAD